MIPGLGMAFDCENGSWVDGGRDKGGGCLSPKPSTSSVYMYINNHTYIQNDESSNS